MKVILKEDVFKLGSLGDEVVVKPGYARNYLIPQGKALPVTRENIKQINHQRNQLAKHRADAIDQAKAMADKLAETEIVFTMKSGESGKLFGSVTQKHIYEALAEKGIELDRKKLHLSAPIKNVGTHELGIKLHTEVTGTLTVKVAAEVVESSETAESTEEAAEETKQAKDQAAEATETAETAEATETPADPEEKPSE